MNLLKDSEADPDQDLYTGFLKKDIAKEGIRWYLILFLKTKMQVLLKNVV